MASVVLTGDTSGTLTLSAPLVAGSNTQTLVAVTGTLAPIVSGTAVASTSGTSIDFTGIPSWVKRITMMLSSVSVSGTSVLLFQLGTSSGVEATGYGGTTWQANTANVAFSAGFAVGTSNAATIQNHGIIQFALIGSNTWAASGNFGRANGVDFCLIGGSKALSGTLDRVRITTAGGANTFTAGTINILYE